MLSEETNELEPSASVDPLEADLYAVAEPVERARFSLPDLQRRFELLAVLLRAGVLGFSLILVVAQGDYDSDILAGVVLATAWCAYATWQRTQYGRQDPVLWAHILAELVLAVAIAAATGGVDSPFSLLALTPLLIIGFSLGDHPLTALVIVGVAVIGSTVALQLAEPRAEQESTLLGAMYLLAGVLGTSVRRLLDEASEAGAQAIDEALQLTRANDLLVALNQVARSLPSSFDLGDVVSEVAPQLRTLLDFDSVAVLVADEASGDWLVEMAEGMRMPGLLKHDELASPLRSAISSPDVVLVTDFLTDAGKGCTPLARSGLYSALRSRGAVVGLLAVESAHSEAFGEADQIVLSEYRNPLALAIDNARWFGRLRRFGADAERTRLARDLHDRLAQSLVYVGFELDRLTTSTDDTRVDLASLRAVVGDVLAELRETLYELRSRVTEDSDLADLAEEYVRRYQTRTGIRVTLDAQVSTRLPLPVEQELWLILLECLANVERHSGATHAIVRVEIGQDAAHLDVRDGGRGFDTALVRADSFGLVGIRERADAIGARVDIESDPGHGTRVRVRLPLEHGSLMPRSNSVAP